jgi:YgiT-type zinc finger domain-containing protein
MICEVCGRERFEQQRVNRSFQVGEKLVLVEGIPAQVCSHCGEASFDSDVAERIRQLVHEPHTPQRVIEAEVLRYDAA